MQHFLRSLRSTHFCTAPNERTSKFRTNYLAFSEFCKNYFAGNPPLVLLHFACDRYFELHSCLLPPASSFCTIVYDRQDVRTSHRTNLNMLSTCCQHIDNCLTFVCQLVVNIILLKCVLSVKFSSVVPILIPV